MKILVVDDSVILRKAIINIFKEMGHEVIGEAGSGFEAIEDYKKLSPDLVTMDITMPGIQGVHNGVEALKQIKEYDSEANIVMVTSHGEEELVLDAIDAGAKGYVLKPVTKDKVKSILEKFQ